MHDVGIIVAGEDKSGATHIRRELVDLVESLIDDIPAKDRVAQISDDKVIRHRGRIRRKLEIYAANPKLLVLESLDQMAADEPARA